MALPTFKSLGAGRLPTVTGSDKVPGPGLKIKIGRFTIGASTYPDGGYLMSDIATLVGFTTVIAVVPCGYATNASHENGFGVSWDGVAAKLQLMANRAQDGNALTVGTGQSVSELATNSSAADGAIFDALVIGY